MVEDEVAGQKLQTDHQRTDEDVGLDQVALEQMDERLVEEGVQQDEQAGLQVTDLDEQVKNHNGVNKGDQQPIEDESPVTDLALL